MGIINSFTKRCIFCKSKGGEIKYVPAYGIYRDTMFGNWYHDSCLMEVACTPGKYNSRTIDMAVDIIDRIKMQKEIAKDLKERMSKKCSYLKQHCI